MNMDLKVDQLNEDVIFYDDGNMKIIVLTDFIRIDNYKIKEENELKFITAIGCL